uniref:Uncharacterized protein n=1 Tax=Fagus sylvatica TaxID=28930 RepID=A0A2N9H3Y0_FAGSY
MLCPRPKGNFNQCCIIRSVPAGTDGKSRTGMQTGTRHPHVPPRLKFLTVSPCFARFGLSELLISRSLLSLLISASPPPRLHQLPPASAFKPSTSYKAASSSPASAFSLQQFNHITAVQNFRFVPPSTVFTICCCSTVPPLLLLL